MAMADALLRLESGRTLRRLARDLRQLEDGREVRKELRKELKGTADRLTRAEKAAALRIPSRGQSARMGRRPLGQRIARATQTRVRMAGSTAGVATWVNPRRMPPGQANLPGYAEGVRPFQRWRSPTFGDWEKAKTQRPHPWFYRTARPYEDDAERAAQRVIDSLADRIERA